MGDQVIEVNPITDFPQPGDDRLAQKAAQDEEEIHPEKAAPEQRQHVLGQRRAVVPKHHGDADKAQPVQIPEPGTCAVSLKRV